jgi:molybdopterin-containing oxidoreductase family iron-sulfur binding subunit
MTTRDDAILKAPNADSHERPALQLDEVRQRLDRAQGPQYWRSLEELAGTEEFQEMMHREFPRFAAEWPQQDEAEAGADGTSGGVSRRGFLELAAASLALAGLTGCTRQPPETIVPFVRQPENYVPGHPLYYATAMEMAGGAVGLLAESHLGRPTKLEGNPEHPASLGATDVMAQASVLSLYDPDRSPAPVYLEQIDSYSRLVDELRARLPALTALQGEGLRILTRTVTSPTLAAQIESLLARFPAARWHQYEPCGEHSARQGAERAFGQPAATRYDLSQADVVLALDADFLTSGPASVRYAKDFSRRRRSATGVHQGAAGGTEGMNRLYVIESSPTGTGATADHRLALAPAELLAFTASLAAELGVAGASAPAAELPEAARAWVSAVADDLRAHRGAGAVIPGSYAPAAVHVLAHAINQALGNVGTTVHHTEPVEARPEDQFDSLRTLADDMRSGAVDTLLILEGNPVYDAPADLDFASTMLDNVPHRVHLSQYRDETSEYCQWHMPAAHYLESWSDCRTFDGTASIVQPLIQPLHGGKTPQELLALFGEATDATSFELVKAHWAAQGVAEGGWRTALHDGLIAGSEAADLALAVDAGAVARACSEAVAAPGLQLCLRPDPSVFDGRFANNAWLQELPKVISKLTWDNAVLVSPALARERGLKTTDLVEISIGDRVVTGPVWVMPGQADGAITVHLGYGRRRAGKVGNGAGFDADPLLTTTARHTVDGVELAATGASYPLSSTQEHFAIELQTAEAAERHLVRHGTFEHFQSEPDFAQHMGHQSPGEDESMFPPWEYKGYAWGLTVDLSACVGCNACVTSCQAENNIPTVGKTQVGNGREMHWIRVDRYYEGGMDEPGVHFQPVMCMQCEQAPCELVCPVAATSHSAEGLNDMVYNRCVGTRYCSNNCPYKVRRFNFLSYTDHDSELLKMLRNPDVTVRSRGVMEKCTYCVQRINYARIESKKENRKIRDGEIQTACQQACPADAIVFGDINDPDSAVSHSKASPLNYPLLAELATRPRTTYLAKVTNPNPALARATAGHGGGHGEPAATGTEGHG